MHLIVVPFMCLSITSTCVLHSISIIFHAKRYCNCITRPRNRHASEMRLPIAIIHASGLISMAFNSCSPKKTCSLSKWSQKLEWSQKLVESYINLFMWLLTFPYLICTYSEHRTTSNWCWDMYWIRTYVVSGVSVSLSTLSSLNWPSCDFFFYAAKSRHISNHALHRCRAFFIYECINVKWKWKPF